MAYPISGTKVLSALVVVMKKHGELSKILSQCTGRIEEDSDQGGYGYGNDNTIVYTLLIEVPPELYADISGEIEGFEKSIKEQLPAISRAYPGHWIGRSDFVLQMNQDASPVAADPSSIGRIWNPGMFRLFISHRSEDKDAAQNIKTNLFTYGVSGFVAHSDIHVTKEWEMEILNALRSMQALVILVTTKLHESSWCNQEIGFALGINVPIIALCVDGNLPQGFAARFQGKHTNSEMLAHKADAIVDILSDNDTTKLKMRECLIEALIQSRSFIDTSTIYNRIVALPELTKEEAERMKVAFKNDQVSTYGASYKIKALIQKHYPRWGKPKTEDDDIPF